ncbi:DEAD/DEAH box helicase family protein [Simiduia curdlanivorans]|uniref:DEAD/DEAH box helicase family protein n=1 Tax=Simiduia curdlanivorans TaxID=1492769 RepID=A0ABV8VAV0_9GAMM|nr:DEAD/DEAH box helicase family protein [Simiduia curdlanivorans]MDN3639319.1 DEAD/DEAH box helicase family protein [Simiduia curdlanivorans]
MVNFDALLGDGEDADYSNLVQVFESLDRKTSHTELRNAQRESLEALSGAQLGDNVLKVSTGAGKTTVGLLFLYRYMRKNNEPVVYLCPTNQLVEQVLAEAEALGVEAVHYKRGEAQPGYKGSSAQAVIVCTYDKLFNAKSTFNRPDVMLRPGAIVLDDAHSGLEIIRRSFCLRLDGDAFRAMVNVLDGECSSYKRSTWKKIKEEDPSAQMEVPYWIWKNNAAGLFTALSEFSEDDRAKFVWPYLSENLHLCRCVMSGAGLEITPYYPLVDASQAYTSAACRLFMSATLADDSSLIRELSCDEKAAMNPVIPPSDKGLGERMVLAPSLVNAALNREEIMQICGQLSANYNVVVLSPSKLLARDWERVGAKVFTDDEVVGGIEALRDPLDPLSFAVFVQRYDGVDLADDAARILVIDGMPYGEGITDKYDSALIDQVGGARRKIIYRIEQGLGRAVRSHVDYACVLLCGEDLANFVAKKDVVESMNFDTQNQIRLGLELSDLLSRERHLTPTLNLVGTMKQCLDRDSSWKRFYKRRVKDVDSPERLINCDAAKFAAEERSSFKCAQSNAFPKAAQKLSDAIGKYIHDEKEIGLYLQRKASYVNNYDSAKAAEIQQGAFNRNSEVCKPLSVVPRSSNVAIVEGELASEWLKRFENPNGAIIEIVRLGSALKFTNSSAIVEQALKELAVLLGALGSRPENEVGEGPDDLWLWPNASLVIEAKTGNANSLHKSDAEQMLASLQWFGNVYPGRAVATPIFVAKTGKVDNLSYFPDEARVIDLVSISALLEALKDMYQSLIDQGPVFWTSELLARQLDSRNLSTGKFLGAFTKKLFE